VENTPDATLRANLAKDAAAKAALGIAGSFNTSPNDNTISRFGWKAQNKSLLLFAGEAFNVEMGVTNELFPNERTIGNGKCTPNSMPEDEVAVLTPTQITNILNNANLGPAGVSSAISSDIENFAVFMRLNGAPGFCAFNSKTDSTGAAQCFSLTTTTGTNGNPSQAAVTSIETGAALFGSTLLPPPATAVASIGCIHCHSDSLTTGPSDAGSLNNATFHPFSDFALHHMGVGDSDGVTQGAAGPDQFRTAPLWGVGQRLFFLHDGRDNNLLTAIQDHCDVDSQTASGAIPVGEACQVITKFNNLSAQNKQDILNFLRSL
jgi:CxxC motif-containing protein (DUF1111 family)